MCCLKQSMDALELLRAGCVIPAVPLALDKNRSWDQKRQRALLRYYLESGAGGLAVAVHTTQFEIRKPEYGLYQPLLQLAAEETEAYIRTSSRPVVKVAGVCGPVEQAVAEATLAKKLGYHAVLLSPGGLSAYDDRYLLERARKVAAILPVIGFYLQTSCGGRRLSYDFWREFCAIENMVALKSAPFDRYQTLDMVRAAATSPRADQITLYTGNDDNIVADLMTTFCFEESGITYRKGFEGGLLGHWAVWTQKAVELLENIRQYRKEGQFTPELMTLAAQITDANAAFFDPSHGFAGCIAGVHEVLHRQGLLEGIWCLNPEETLSPGQKEEIDRVYAMYPHLNDDAFVTANLERWLKD
ncbi:dihydrodipicolinate synthase family protein [Oscillospiraceae bacterium MB08-C2-2]|nr:dihydrodipicolinate synthase family protein [Oscillospiraceae bacterium MB08-C2-2]